MPTPDTFNGEPYKVCEWLFRVELYFFKYQLDLNGTDAQLPASLLWGNALQWYYIASLRDPATVPDTYTALKTKIEMQIIVISKKKIRCKLQL